MKRPKKKAEGRPLSCPRERGTLVKLSTALDIGRGQRPQRSRYFLKREIGEVPRFKKAHPFGKAGWLVHSGIVLAALRPGGIDANDHDAIGRTTDLDSWA